MSQSRYSIHERMIVDAEGNPVPRIHIRELLDAPSDEFRRSRLGAAQKLEIIESLGLDELIGVLDELYRLGGKSYDARQEARYAMQWIRGLSPASVESRR